MVECGGLSGGTGAGGRLRTGGSDARLRLRCIWGSGSGAGRPAA